MSIAAHRPERPASGDRLASWLRRLRWPVMIAWVIAIVLLEPLASGLSKVTNDTASAYLPASAPSTRVAELQQAAQHGPGQPETDTVVVLFTRRAGLTTADLAAVGSARAAVTQLAGHVRGLAAPGRPRRSADGQADAFAAGVTAPSNSVTTVDTDAVKAIRQAVSGTASRASPGLRATVTGSAALNADSGISSKTQTKLLLAALIIVVIILLLVYRSPLLWLLPLFGAIGAIVVAKAATHGLASAGLTVSSLSAAILTVLVLGAASDYALLLTHRYREELRQHAATEDAMAAALRRTVPTLAASAATVICAMICLLAAESASLHGLGPVGAVGIATALLAQVTFLPALLLVFGRAAFWPRIPRAGQAGHEESRLWSGVGQRVARHPGWTTLVAAVLLGAVCLSLAAARITNNPLDTVKGHPGSVTGANLLAEHYGAGVNDPLTVLARPADAGAAAAAARATGGVATVAPSGPVGGYASYSVTLSVPPYGASGSAAIQNLRHRLDRAAPGSLVGGGPAIQHDITQAAHHDTWVLFPLVFAVIFVIIAVLLQAIVAPLVLVATTALSFAAAFGLADLIWRYGFGYAGVEAQLPLYIFIFLVALGVDYNIFLSARIREEARQLGTRQGTLRGLAVTGGVITAAGFVMAGTFAALTQLPSVPVAEVGIAVAVGVLLDTLLVRTVLVPAALLTLGERAWWPSRPAGVDRGPRPRLPRSRPAAMPAD
ncbi:MAG TPA: MMPL family transporter [Streptosporangiaceae bacterium]|nr:MMPL family transporter [Streptosporangiaceae bacterium]